MDHSFWLNRSNWRKLLKSTRERRPCRPITFSLISIFQEKEKQRQTASKNSIYSGLMPILGYSCHEPPRSTVVSWTVEVDLQGRPFWSTASVQLPHLLPFRLSTHLIISKVGFAGCELACQVLLDAKFLNVNLERTKLGRQDILLCVENHSIKLQFFWFI